MLYATNGLPPPDQTGRFAGVFVCSAGRLPAIPAHTGSNVYAVDTASDATFACRIACACKCVHDIYWSDDDAHVLLANGPAPTSPVDALTFAVAYAMYASDKTLAQAHALVQQTCDIQFEMDPRHRSALAAHDPGVGPTLWRLVHDVHPTTGTLVPPSPK